MRVAVTGGSGFIGRATIKWARQYGHEAWSFDRTKGQDILGPLDGLHGADVVVNLAGVLGTAELFDRPEQAVDVNIHGALRVLRWCEENGAGYVGITMPPVFESVYTATKLCADRLATAWHLFRGVPVAKVKAYNAYGPGQKHGKGHPQKILPTFATEAWAGRPIPVWGDVEAAVHRDAPDPELGGEQTVDLVHADDVGRMLVEAAEHGDDAVFDAGTGTAVTVNELAAFVLEVTGSKAGIEYLPMRDGEVPTRIVAEGEGWDRLTWKPEHSWDRIAEAVRSYRP